MSSAFQYAKILENLGPDRTMARWNPYLAIQHVPKPIAILVLITIFTLSYLMSLQGGSLLFIHEHLTAIGIQLGVSVLSLTAITVMLYAARMRQGTRRATVLLVALIAAALYAYDHGERFETHGFYNILVFLAIYVPLNLAIAVFYILWCKIDNFLSYFTVTAVTLGIFTAISLVYYRRQFDVGLLGKFEYISEECQWTGRNIPYVDLLPAGAQNFWAGPSHCAPEPLHITTSIDADGVLTVDCGKPDVAAIYIDILPETRHWPLRDKGMIGVYNHLVLERTIRLPYTPDIPFVLNKTTQAIVVRCDSSSKIVTRVSPSVHTIPDYVPPKDTDTRTDHSTNASAVFHSNGILHANHKRPNIVFLMLDAVSRRQFLRRLPKSSNALRSMERPGSHRLVEFFRYHSVGFSTDNNTRAMYTGDVVRGRRNPLPIWTYFRDRGYITARVETECDDWVKENVGDNFDDQGYAVSNRTLDYELASPFCMPEYFPNVGNPFGNFKGPFSIVARCLYGRYVHDWAFDHLSQLRTHFRSRNNRRSYRRKPYMISGTFMEGHEGTGEVINTVDDALSEFLESMQETGELEDTVLVIAADHGLHMGLNFAYTQNGRIEHQNPFMAISVPEWLYQFAEEYQQEHAFEKISPFAANTQRLITPVETYHTLRVLADWPRFNTDNWQRSLFAAQKAGRTCDEAQIDQLYCMCKHR